MPAVAHLPRLWSAFAHSRSIFRGAITADHINRGMLLQPGFDTLHRAVGEQINGLTALQVTDQRAVAESALVWSGKGNAVPSIPSPKNWTGEFPHIQLKPFSPPVSPDAASQRVNPGRQPGGGR